MKESIAIVEDDTWLRECLVELVSSRTPLEIFDFPSPTEMLMSGKKFDVILSDWNFGHIDLGFFLENIDKRKLIILTGSAKVSIDCAHVMEKSFNPNELIERVMLLAKKT